jgi:hypothetical protein
MFKIKSSNFQNFKQNHLLHVSSNAPTIIIPSAGNISLTPTKSLKHTGSVWEKLDPNICDIVINPTASERKECIAFVFADAVRSLPQAPPRIRMELIDVKSKEKLKPLAGTNSYPTTGLFGHAGAYGNGRAVVRSQLGNLFEHLDDMERIILAKLEASHSYLKPGDDVILIVLNDGEIDIFINFACSLRAHGLEASYLHRVVVFAGSDDLADMVDATGAIGIYHHSFYQVNRGASYQYLDKTFTDMMWYKSFSLYMMLRLKFNVLFQVRECRLQNNMLYNNIDDDYFALGYNELFYRTRIWYGLRSRSATSATTRPPHLIGTLNRLCSLVTTVREPCDIHHSTPTRDSTICPTIMRRNTSLIT